MNKNKHTLNQPMQFLGTRALCPSDPSFLRSEEFDELEGAKKLVNNAHPPISCCHDSLLYANCSAGQDVVERPSEKQSAKACERRHPEKLVEENRRDQDFKWCAVQEMHACEKLNEKNQFRRAA